MVIPSNYISLTFIDLLPAPILEALLPPSALSERLLPGSSLGHNCSKLGILFFTGWCVLWEVNFMIKGILFVCLN